jgi:hypothetical protein
MRSWLIVCTRSHRRYGSRSPLYTKLVNAMSEVAGQLLMAASLLIGLVAVVQRHLLPVDAMFLLTLLALVLGGDLAGRW